MPEMHACMHTRRVSVGTLSRRSLYATRPCEFIGTVSLKHSRLVIYASPPSHSCSNVSEAWARASRTWYQVHRGVSVWPSSRSYCRSQTSALFLQLPGRRRNLRSCKSWLRSTKTVCTLSSSTLLAVTQRRSVFTACFSHMVAVYCPGQACPHGLSQLSWSTAGGC